MRIAILFMALSSVSLSAQTLVTCAPDLKNTVESYKPGIKVLIPTAKHKANGVFAARKKSQSFEVRLVSLADLREGAGRIQATVIQYKTGLAFEFTIPSVSPGIYAVYRQGEPQGCRFRITN